MTLGKIFDAIALAVLLLTLAEAFRLGPLSILYTTFEIAGGFALGVIASMRRTGGAGMPP